MKSLIHPQRRSPLAKLKSWGVKPLVLDFYLQQIWPTFSIERVLARVLTKQRLTHDVTLLLLEPNFNFRKFRAGQHILLTISVNGSCYTRPYSPTQTARGLEIAIKNIPDGKVSGEIHQSLKPGAIVEISQAFGEMTWDELPHSAHYTFCAGGIGITPLRSLIQSWTKNPKATIDLHYWARTEEDFCFRDELFEIEKQIPQLKIQLYSTRSVSSPALKPETSLFSSAETVFVGCGPQNFVRLIESIALNKNRKFFGEFAQISGSKKTRNLEQESFFDMKYEGHSFQASSQKTILESLEEHGIRPIHGCRMGICKSCTCLKVAGVSHNVKNNSISDEANEEIQICVTKPRSAMNIKGY